MSWTEEDRIREERETEARNRLRAETEANEKEKMAKWAAYCKKPIKVDELCLEMRQGMPSGSIYRVAGVIAKPDPKVHGSGRYRIEYVGEASARELGQIREMPLGVYETLGDPGDRLRK